MIGCGHIESGRWAFESFVVDDLSKVAEARTIDKWLEHMDFVRRRMDPDGEPAEVMASAVVQEAYLGRPIDGEIADV